MCPTLRYQSSIRYTGLLKSVTNYEMSAEREILERPLLTSPHIKLANTSQTNVFEQTLCICTLATDAH